jgi:hypothetical protein
MQQYAESSGPRAGQLPRSTDSDHRLGWLTAASRLVFAAGRAEVKMQRRILRAAGAGALVASIALAVAACGGSTHMGSTHVAGSTHVHFTEIGNGALISKTQTVYKVHNSVAGDGAAVVTSTGPTTDKGVEYFGGGSVNFRDPFIKLGAPNSQGIATLTGSGIEAGGTGKFKHIRGSYTFSGTYNAKTGTSRYTLTGTESY